MKATFAGGCFWCVVGPFETLDGVSDVLTGYTGGIRENPPYEHVAMGLTQHREAIEFEYNEEKVDYADLVETFFWQIDPTDDGGQFADRGHQYTTAIYYHSDEQRDIALAHIKKLDASGKFDSPIVTEVLPAKPFYVAEEKHQGFYKKNPKYYERYKKGSGRAGYLAETWGGHPSGDDVGHQTSDVGNTAL